jgi:hypothetical protein
MKVVGTVLGVIGLLFSSWWRELWLRRSGGRRASGCSGDLRRLCDQIEVQGQSVIMPTVKSGIAPANFAMTDWESFDVRFGSKADQGAWLKASPLLPSKQTSSGHAQKTPAAL